jgi:hypothetical protein
MLAFAAKAAIEGILAVAAGIRRHIVPFRPSLEWFRPIQPI